MKTNMLVSPEQKRGLAALLSMVVGGLAGRATEGNVTVLAKPPVAPPELVVPEQPLAQAASGRWLLAMVLFDYENIHLGLVQQGWHFDAAALAACVRAELGKLGYLIVQMRAYADFRRLSPEGMRMMDELGRAGIQPLHVPSEPHKNSVDGKLTAEACMLLRRDPLAPDYADTYFIASRDGDQRATLDAIKQCGRKSALIALHEGLSAALVAAAGDDVYYLDDWLGVPHVHAGAAAPAARPALGSAPAPRRPGASPVEPGTLTADDLARLTVLAAAFLRRRKWHWAPRQAMAGALGPDDLGQRRLQGLLEAGICVRRQPAESDVAEDRIALAPEHPLVQAARHLIAWAPGRIDYALHHNGWPYVDTRYLARGMQMDSQCVRLGIGQTRPQAERWLEYLVEAGVLVSRRERHATQPGWIVAWDVAPAAQ